MTITQARGAIGRTVIYRAPHVHRSELGTPGVITSVNTRFVFVRYEAQDHSQATPPEALTLVGAR